MKLLNLAGWISLGIGVIIIALGVISGIADTSLIKPVQHLVNYFTVANSFFLFAIAMFICDNKKQGDK